MNKTVSFEVEPAQNGYIVNIGGIKFIYTDEIEVLECIREWLNFDTENTIEIKRK